MKASGSVIVIGEGDVTPVVPRYRRPAHWPGRSMAVAATVILHLLVSAPLILGTAAHKKRSKDPQSNGSVEYSSKGEEVESMILLDLSAISVDQSDDFVPDIDAEGIIQEEVRLALASQVKLLASEPILDEADFADEVNKEAGDPAGSAALFGKYMNHVAARIERAWMRPRSPVESGHFDCRVRISQNRQGSVLAVSLEKCGDNEAWRRSLETAILRASPLSGPPEPWLFTPTLALNFSADQYDVGRTPEYLYEPAALAVAQNTNSELPQAVIPQGGDLQLTITGSQVEWKQK